MAKKYSVKIRGKVIELKYRDSWKWKLGVFGTSLALILGALCWMALPLPQNFETEIPFRPGSYTAQIMDYDCLSESENRIRLKFSAAEPAKTNTPEYRMEEIFEQAKTVIVFEKVSQISGWLDYEKIIGSPLIESIDYNVKDNRLTMEIFRKGIYSPAQINGGGAIVEIALFRPDDGYPEISKQNPPDNSAVFPARRAISFEAKLDAPLKSAAVFFNNKAVEFDTEKKRGGEYVYIFSFETELENEKEYPVKAIIADEKGRAAAGSWSFSAQTPGAAALGKDRFKYLGWWGRVNADGVNVRKGVAITSEKVGSLSTTNRVKVIREVYGEWINGKNLWYQIDGGMYAGAYIFSDFVAPMEQPEPPEDFAIPQEVKENEKWIDVDLAKKILTLFEYDKPMFATYIAPGREENPTQAGAYRIWYKLAEGEMQGGPPLHSYRYHLKNIPWIMYYNYDYAIHGTYWHDKFGMPQSAGCTNMTQGDAKFIFENTLPDLAEGQEEAFSRDKPNVGYGTGTVVYNHE